jgi:hypothetical protein
MSGTQNGGKWAGDIIVDTLNWTTTVPATLAPGEYLMRHELIAVHQANNPQCMYFTILILPTAVILSPIPPMSRHFMERKIG